MNFSVVVFDTPNPGYTLKLFTFPNKLKKATEKMLALKNTYVPYLNRISMFFGMNFNVDDISRKLEDILSTIEIVKEQFKNPVSNQRIFISYKIGLKYNFF